MKKTTLCFLVNQNSVLLAMKKRGFGVGKLNGVGGKVGDGERVEDAACREVHEEIGVNVSPQDLERRGTISFLFDEKPEWNQECHIFVGSKWVGDPEESEEMKPEWHHVHNLPFHSMWVDDPHWLPLVLADKKIKGEFFFDAEGKTMKSFSVQEW